MIDEYLTISSHGKYEYKELGSRFIGLCYPATTKEEIEEILRLNKKEYYDATHNCFAYRLGVKGINFRFNDDREPNSSAGKPILSAIDSHGVTDTLVIVNRYFGGKKLGVSGLITAYSTSAKEAINNSNIIKKIIYTELALSFEHPLVSQVMHTIEKYQAKIIKQEYTEIVKFIIQIKPSIKEDFEKYLISKTYGKVNFIDKI